MNSKFLDETNKDFKEFVEADSTNPPRELKENIFSLVHRDLNPNPWFIFSKLSLIHLTVGLLTLSLCPQFGIRFFGEGLGVMRFFLHFGAYGCIALCGAFFVGTSLFVSGLVLRIEELRVLRGHRWLQISGLTFLSLGALIMLDAEILFAFGLTWIVGSIFGGIALLELGRYARFNLPVVRT